MEQELYGNWQLDKTNHACECGCPDMQIIRFSKDYPVYKCPACKCTDNTNPKNQELKRKIDARIRIYGR